MLIMYMPVSLHALSLDHADGATNQDEKMNRQKVTVYIKQIVRCMSFYNI